MLPDLSTNRKGRIRHPDDIITETDQILVMNNERFTVPELLFRPDDIGAYRRFISLPTSLVLAEIGWCITDTVTYRILITRSQDWIKRVFLPRFPTLYRSFPAIYRACFGPILA